MTTVPEKSLIKQIGVQEVRFTRLERTYGILEFRFRHFFYHIVANS